MIPGIDFIQDFALILISAALAGWICRRLGISVVAGFLLAGMLVGPHMPPVSLVTSQTRVDTAAQVGLVFLMFALGLRLSIHRLRRLGISLICAVLAGAALIFYLTRLLALALDLGGQQSLFLAAMLMVSSSTIIGRMLQESGGSHERSGQLALGVTAIEDLLAVVMLAVLGAAVRMEGGAAEGLGQTLGVFGSFVVLAGIAGLLLVPRLLRKMRMAVDDELQTLGMAALLFGLALLAHRAGYSLAVGAFLLGSIVAETAHRHQVERAFEGMRDIFGAVFFVTVGMLIDPFMLLECWWMAVALAVFALCARTLAVSTGLTLTGTPARDALRAGLTVTPIGEFSFVIAQMGVLAGVLPERFRVLAVGVSLLTAAAGPVLSRRSAEISGWVFARQPFWLAAWLQYYHGWLGRMQARKKRSLLWQLSRKRIIQISVEMLLVTGVLVFSEQAFGLLEERLGRDWLFPYGLAVIFWCALSLVVLAPLVAIWRNLSAVSLLYAQVSTRGHPRAVRLRPLVEGGFKVLAGVGLFVWLGALLPTGGAMRWVLLGTVLVAAGALLILKRRLVYWHSELEVELEDMLEADPRKTATTVPWLHTHGDWKLSVGESVLPDLADCQGRRIDELDLRAQSGASVVGIERQGYLIALPPPETVLYARDRVLLMGTAAQVRAARRLLRAATGKAVGAPSEFDDMVMESIRVPAWGPNEERTLKELAPASMHQVQIAGIHRGGVRILSPGAGEVIRPGDELLVLGTPDNIENFKDWLTEDMPE